MALDTPCSCSPTLFFAAASRSAWCKLFRQQAYLWLPAAWLCSRYDVRHLCSWIQVCAPFVLLLWLAVPFAVFCLRMRPEVPPAFLLSPISSPPSAFTVLKGPSLPSSDLLAMRSRPRNVDWQGRASPLRAAGLQTGVPFRLSARRGMHWRPCGGQKKSLRKSRFGDEDVFFDPAPEATKGVFRILAGTGAQMVVTRYRAAIAATKDGIPLGNSSFYAHPLAVGPLSSENSTDPKTMTLRPDYDTWHQRIFDAAPETHEMLSSPLLSPSPGPRIYR